MYSDPEIQEVMAAEIGSLDHDASRLLFIPGGKNEGGECHLVGMFHRDVTREGYVPPPRCTFTDENGRQCTYAQWKCPGHKKIDIYRNPSGKPLIGTVAPEPPKPGDTRQVIRAKTRKLAFNDITANAPVLPRQIRREVSRHARLEE